MIVVPTIGNRGLEEWSLEVIEVISRKDPRHMRKNIHVPLPKDCKSVSEWGKTRNEMDRFKAKRWTYSDMVDLAMQGNAAGQEVSQYLKWIKNCYGKEGGQKIPTKITGCRPCDVLGAHGLDRKGNQPWPD